MYEKINDNTFIEKKDVLKKVTDSVVDLVDTTFDTSRDVEALNDLINGEIYLSWVKSVENDASLSSEKKSVEFEKIAMSYQKEREQCEKIVNTQRTQHTDNAVWIFQKIVIPTFFFIVSLEGVKLITKKNFTVK